jgi:uncharacterized protein YPO0396
MDIVTRLRAVLHNDRSVELMNREAADEIERLRAERDEARREICENVAAISASVNAKQWAQERGWDCYRGDGK